MNLFFTPHDPEACLISTATDVSCYFVDTHILTNGRYITSIKRPEASQAEALVAEISWRCWGEPTMVRCPLVKKGFASFPSAEFLYKKHHFRASTSRYFMANDGVEYCWRRVKGAGFVLTHAGNKEEIAKFERIGLEHGPLAGHRRSGLVISSGCRINLDLVVLTYIIMERKRRQNMDPDTAHDDDPQGEAGIEA